MRRYTKPVIAALLTLCFGCASVPAHAGTAILSWQRPTQNCGGGTATITGFKVYWGPVGRVAAGLPASSTGSCGEATSVSPTNPKVAVAYPKAVIVINNAAATTINVTMPNDGQRYYFAITAMDANGESYLSNEASKLGVPGSTNATMTWEQQ